MANGNIRHQLNNGYVAQFNHQRGKDYLVNVFKGTEQIALVPLVWEDENIYQIDENGFKKLIGVEMWFTSMDNYDAYLSQPELLAVIGRRSVNKDGVSVKESMDKLVSVDIRTEPVRIPGKPFYKVMAFVTALKR